MEKVSAPHPVLRNRLKSLFRSEISEIRRRGDFAGAKYASRLAAKMMKDEEAYAEYTLTNPESFAAEFLKL